MLKCDAYNICVVDPMGCFRCVSMCQYAGNGVGNMVQCSHNASVFYNAFDFVLIV